MSRKEFDTANDLSRRVCILENKPLLDSGKISQSEFDSKLEECHVGPSLLPMQARAMERIKLIITGSHGEVPNTFSIVLSGLALMHYSH